MARSFSSRNLGQNTVFNDVGKLFVSLSSNCDGNCEKFDIKQARNALKSLTSSQSTLKSLDRVTHKLRNTIKEHTSLGARFNKFLSSSKHNGKEGGKLFEYTSGVERALQAAEILQSVSIEDDTVRKEHLHGIGLTELNRQWIVHNNINCSVSVLAASKDYTTQYEQDRLASGTLDNEEKRKLQSTPRRYLPNELIIAICDLSTIESEVSSATIQPLMTALYNDVPIVAELSGDDFIQDEVSLQPTILSLSHKVLSVVSDYITPKHVAVETSESRGIDIEDSRHKKGIRKRAISTTVGINSKRVSGNVNDKGDDGTTITIAMARKEALTTTPFGNADPTRLRIVGHSAGGAVAAYISMILDGTLSLKSVVIPADSATGSSYDELDFTKYSGLYSGNIRCVALGPPPCVSRSIVPQYVRSVICGDDMVVRSTQESIATFLRRVRKAIERGAGSSLPVSYMLGAKWLGDMKSVAGKSIKRYRGSKHDVSSLSLPGRVLFIKNRDIKKGATIQRVMRGNWQEDVLWQLHEIVPSEKMLKHHSLESYIQTLNRC